MLAGHPSNKIYVLYCNCIVLYRILLYCIVLYYIVLYCIVLYCMQSFLHPRSPTQNFNDGEVRQRFIFYTQKNHHFF